MDCIDRPAGTPGTAEEPEELNYFLQTPSPLWELDLSELAHTSPEKELSPQERISRARIRRVNPAALALYGASRVDQLRENMPRIIGPEGRTTLAQAAQAIREGRTEYTAQTVNYRLDGTPLSILLHLKIPPASARCLGRVLLSTTDITPLEQARKERELYYQAFHSSIQAIVITDPAGIIQYINPKVTEIYGCPPEEAVGRRPRIFNPGLEVYQDLGYSEEDYRRLFSGLWEAITDPARGSWQGILANRDSRGRILWVRLIINALYAPDGSVSHFLGFPVDITDTVDQERTIRTEMLRTITETAEMRDNETGNHILRVGLYARRLAEQMGLPRKYCQDLEIFAQHHDIGKVGISDTILLAPRRLTEEEFRIMQTHPEMAHRILADKPTMQMADEISRCHHERYDGTGYPRGLKGRDIPLAARLTALADVYDALRSRRPYKEPWNHADAAAEIRAGAGTQFDPDATAAFEAVQEDFARIAREFKDEKNAPAG